MDLSFFQNVGEKVLSDTLIKVIGVVVAAMIMALAKLKERRPYSVVILMGIFAYGGIVWVLGHPTGLWWRGVQTLSVDMDSKEMAQNIQNWLNDFHFTTQKIDKDDAYFSFIAQGANKIPVEVVRIKGERDQYITIASRLALSPEDKKSLESLPETIGKGIVDDVAIEAMRQKAVSKINLPDEVSFEERFPISEATQAKLIDNIDDITHAMNLISFKFRSLIYSEIQKKSLIK